MKGRAYSKGAVLAAVLVFILMASGVAQAKRKKRVMLIHPGKGVGKLLLGDGPAQFNAVFPNTPGGRNHSYTGGGAGCPLEFYFWYNDDEDPSDVTAYTAELSGEQFTLFAVRGPKFALPNGMWAFNSPDGISSGTTMRQVERVYTDGHLYVRTNTGSTLNNGRNLLYWVVRNLGIAFQLVWIPSERQRVVDRIWVFPPKTSFKPQGCIYAPDHYRKIR